ncbi:MAG: sigma-70 factor domain-containing protein, partial [Acidobacteriota bacterium]
MTERVAEEAIRRFDEMDSLGTVDGFPGQELGIEEAAIDGTAAELDDADEPLELIEKTNDPVRMYLREMGTVPLLTREGEISLARNIERGQKAVLQVLSRSPLVVNEVIQLGAELEQGEISIYDLLSLNESGGPE